jgi:hypothetical protein
MQPWTASGSTDSLNGKDGTRCPDPLPKAQVDTRFADREQADTGRRADRPAALLLPCQPDNALINKTNPQSFADDKTYMYHQRCSPTTACLEAMKTSHFVQVGLLSRTAKTRRKQARQKR